MNTEVRDAAGRRRYEIYADGDLAGFAEYEDLGDARVFTHTEVSEEFEGRGLGSALALGALEDVRAAGHSTVALCPFIRHVLDEHPEYAELVDTTLDAQLRRRRRRSGAGAAEEG